jgi:hypothetical protein
MGTYYHEAKIIIKTNCDNSEKLYHDIRSLLKEDFQNLLQTA